LKIPDINWLTRRFIFLKKIGAIRTLLSRTNFFKKLKKLKFHEKQTSKTIKLKSRQQHKTLNNFINNIKIINKNKCILLYNFDEQKNTKNEQNANLLNCCHHGYDWYFAIGI
jgi:superfamily II RNA helicase